MSLTSQQTGSWRAEAGLKQTFSAGLIFIWTSSHCAPPQKKESGIGPRELLWPDFLSIAFSFFLWTLETGIHLSPHPLGLEENHNIWLSAALQTCIFHQPIDFNSFFSQHSVMVLVFLVSTYQSWLYLIYLLCCNMYGYTVECCNRLYTV